MSDVYDRIFSETVTPPIRRARKRVRWRIELRIGGWSVIREELSRGHRVISGRVIRHGIESKEEARIICDELEKGYAP